MLTRNVVDQLLDDNGLADAGSAKETNLSALQERLDEVDDLDAGLEHLFLGGLLVEGRSLTMDRQTDLRIHGPKLVHRLTEHIQHAAQRLATHRHRNACAGIDRLHATDHAFGRDHRDAAHAAFAKVLLHFDHDVEWGGDDEAFADDAQRLEDGRHV
jgi:hypothetical protein